MIKAGFIGTGVISGAHLEFLQSRDDVKITALCDVNPENLKKKQDEFGGEGFDDFNVMLEKTELDAVWICTPPKVRREPLIACVDRHIPIFCEKPVERSEERAREIADELAGRDAKVQIGYVFRSTPVIQKLREAMADDKIHVVQSFYGCGVGISRSLPDWFYDKEISGGALVDQATHNFDLLRYLFGEVKQARGLASNPVTPKKPGYTIDETIGLSLLFESGMMCSHSHTWVGDRWFNEIFLSGEKRIYRLGLWNGSLIVDEGGEQTPFSQGDRSIYAYQNEIFLDMVTSDDWSKNPCSYEDGLASLRLTLACDRALGEEK